MWPLPLVSRSNPVLTSTFLVHICFTLRNQKRKIQSYKKRKCRENFGCLDRTRCSQDSPAATSEGAILGRGSDRGDSEEEGEGGGRGGKGGKWGKRREVGEGRG